MGLLFGKACSRSIRLSLKNAKLAGEVAVGRRLFGSRLLTKSFKNLDKKSMITDNLNNLWEGLLSGMKINFLITFFHFMHFFLYWTKCTINFIIWSRCSFIYRQSRFNKIGNFNEVSLFNHIPINSWPVRSCSWGMWGCYWRRWWNWPRPRMNSVSHNN